MPVTPRASVRAMITKSGSRRADTAALILATISPADTSTLPDRWPQRLGNSWSSRWRPATPASSKRRTVRSTLTASPKPVSASQRMREAGAARQGAGKFDEFGQRDQAHVGKCQRRRQGGPGEVHGPEAQPFRHPGDQGVEHAWNRHGPACDGLPETPARAVHG